MKKTNQIDNAARNNDENKEILNVSFKEFFIYYFVCDDILCFCEESEKSD